MFSEFLSLHLINWYIGIEHNILYQFSYCSCSSLRQKIIDFNPYKITNVQFYFVEIFLYNKIKCFLKKIYSILNL